jgi:N-acylneuraminate cytidylyltransferase
MRNLAIIPARGGSKRIPRKNIRDFLGKPIIAYSIEVALKSGLFEEVMVSTNDKEIAEIALKFGAKVPFMRSPNASNDQATTMEVLLEVLENYEKVQRKVFEKICCIYPTAPLIKEEHLRAGYDLLINKGFYSVLPVVPFSYPIWRGLKFETGEKIKMIWPEFQNSRSQDLEKAFHDAGQWYWLDPRNINKSIFTENTGYIILEETQVQDIDHLSDWKMAELKYRARNEA